MDLAEVMRHGAMAGVRVLDFTWVRAGPQSTRILSMFGAEVIRIEWPEHPDVIRLGSPRQTPRGMSPGLNTNADFNNFNCNKLSVTLNVKEEAGLDYVKQLVAISDIVIENYSSRVLETWGLGYEDLRVINPTIVYVSMAGFGHSGRHRDYDTWGPAVQALSGLTFLSGFPDRAPAGWGHSYMDHTGGYYGAMAALAALHYRNRIGRGQYVDLSQVEVGCTMTGPSFLDYTANGRTARREGMPPGNRTHWPETPLTSTYRGPHAAPHNAYRCAGGGMNDWVTIACFTDEEWRGLVRAMGDPPWADSPEYASLISRLEHQEALDASIGKWAMELSKYEAVKRLQAEGVPSAPVQGMSDRLERDPQLQHRGLFAQRSNHPIVGDQPYEGMPMRLRNSPWALWRHGPLMGQDNETVVKELLGVRQETIEALNEEGVFWPRKMIRDEARA